MIGKRPNFAGQPLAVSLRHLNGLGAERGGALEAAGVGVGEDHPRRPSASAQAAA